MDRHFRPLQKYSSAVKAVDIWNKAKILLNNSLVKVLFSHDCRLLLAKGFTSFAYNFYFTR